MLLLGFEAAWRTDQNAVAAVTETCPMVSRGQSVASLICHVLSTGKCWNRSALFRDEGGLAALKTKTSRQTGQSETMWKYTIFCRNNIYKSIFFSLPSSFNILHTQTASKNTRNKTRWWTHSKPPQQLFIGWRIKATKTPTQLVSHICSHTYTHTRKDTVKHMPASKLYMTSPLKFPSVAGFIHLPTAREMVRVTLKGL